MVITIDTDKKELTINKAVTFEELAKFVEANNLQDYKIVSQHVLTISPPVQPKVNEPYSPFPNRPYQTWL